MNIKQLTIALALTTLVPASLTVYAAPAENAAPVPAEVLQAAQSALAAGDLKALQAVFEANPTIVVQLASALTLANKSAAATIATVAAKAFPAQAKKIQAAVVAAAPEQSDAVEAVLSPLLSDGSSSAQGNNGQFGEFPSSKVDPSIVSPSS